MTLSYHFNLTGIVVLSLLKEKLIPSCAIRDLYMKNWKGLTVLGFVTGFTGTSLGIGGGVIMVPALMMLFLYDIKKAVGTSLATIVAGSFVGVVTYYAINSANIKFGMAVLIAVGALVGAKQGVILTNRINSRLLKQVFSVFLLILALRTAGVLNFQPAVSCDLYGCPFLLMALGFAAGLASALFGIGGGILMVPALNMFFGLSMHEAIATSLTVVVPTTLAGAVFHSEFDNVDKSAIKVLIPAALAGATLGAGTASILPAYVLRNIFSVVMILCAVRMFFRKGR
ncbi:MAG: sulfite exporter TauE/SafE family protein [Candidatus Omnitrophota bacterium]